MTVQWARDENNDMLLPTIGNGATAIERDPRTCAKIKLDGVLAFVQGEWFLDTRSGFPWFQWLGESNPNITALRAALRKYILATPPVVAIANLPVSYDPSLRNVAYAWAVRIVGGAAVSSS